MSLAYAQLCSIIILETFGKVAKQLMDALLYGGPSTFIALKAATQLPHETVQTGLRTFIQHNIVSFKRIGKTKKYNYTANFDSIIELTRYHKYSVHIEEELGTEAKCIIDALVEAGQISLSHLLYIRAKRVAATYPQFTETQLLECLELSRTTVIKLAAFKYIRIIPNELVEDCDAPESSWYQVPEVDFDKICKKFTDSESIKPEEFSDFEISWGVNVPKLHALLRDKLVFHLINNKLNGLVDPLIFKYIIDRGMEKYLWEPEGSPVSASEIHDFLAKHGQSDSTQKCLSQHLQLLEEHSNGVISRLSNVHGGSLAINMKRAVEKLFWDTVFEIVAVRHGPQALRIFALVKENSYAEQDTINEKGMIPGKEAKTVTYKLVEDRLLVIKEVKKSYASTQPGASEYVFHVDPSQVIRFMQEYCYSAIYNTNIRIALEVKKVKRLTSKEDKISRIVINMLKKQCTEQQINEVRELLTPPERQLLLNHNQLTTSLYYAAMQIDEALFITELYLKYNNDPSNKKGVKRKK